MIKLSENSISLIFRLIIIFVVIKAIMVGLLMTLPHTGVTKITVPDVTPPYTRFNIKNAFYTTNSKTKKEDVKPKQPLYKIDDMELTGIYMESKKSGFVVFYDKKDKEQHILSVGETYKGYKLDSLSKYEAIFIRNNQHYKLSFKDDSSIPVEPKKILTQTDEEEPVRLVPKNLVKKYSTDFKAIWKDISIKEIIKHGKIAGFKIQSVKKGSVFSQLGLQKGDIIVEVNDKPIKTYKAAFDIYKNINKYRDLKIKILRNGIEKEFNYEIY
ncbi:PDZ domain-containing protein [Hydrogenimonas thermophila]|uniref:Type II secretion system protein C n=1 Tax=Hydrogenimonas thermophila TaxID=223786 RepID=A0A1I5M625_9BACT|nr:PDZ domain-containing protein [Hydrogenimonas thermophila]SFP05088.1 type II secretion system protein C [Hydrogenimonas thermophila]